MVFRFFALFPIKLGDGELWQPLLDSIKAFFISSTVAIAMGTIGEPRGVVEEDVLPELMEIWEMMILDFSAD